VGVALFWIALATARRRLSGWVQQPGIARAGLRVCLGELVLVRQSRVADSAASHPHHAGRHRIGARVHASGASGVRNLAACDGVRRSLPFRDDRRRTNPAGDVWQLMMGAGDVLSAGGNPYATRFDTVGRSLRYQVSRTRRRSSQSQRWRAQWGSTSGFCCSPACFSGRVSSVRWRSGPAGHDEPVTFWGSCASSAENGYVVQYAYSEAVSFPLLAAGCSSCKAVRSVPDSHVSGCSPRPSSTLPGRSAIPVPLSDSAPGRHIRGRRERAVGALSALERLRACHLGLLVPGSAAAANGSLTFNTWLFNSGMATIPRWVPVLRAS